MSMLCSLTDVKAMLNITDDIQDSKLTLMIKSASAKIEEYVGYNLGRGEYTEELHAVNNRQLLHLNHFPLQNVSSVTVGGFAVTDYLVLPEYSRFGDLYRGSGWTGSCWTRGFTNDIVSGTYSIVASYTAGYYLPGDEGYIEGADDSLPYAISAVCAEMVCMKYNADAMGATGLKAHTEGHISDTYSDDVNDYGLSESARKILSGYVYYGVA